MRITLLTHSPGPGGSSSMLGQLRVWLHGLGHSVSVVVGADSPAPVIGDYHICPASTDWRERMRLYVKTVEGTRPDLVYSLSGVDEADVLRFLQCPRIRHVFSLEQHAYLNMPRLLQRLAPFVECLTANTPDVLDSCWLHSRNDSVRRVLAPYRIQAVFQRGASLQRKAGAALEICFIGRMESFQKRVHWLPEIISRCHKRHPEVAWSLYGTGPWEGAFLQEISRRQLGSVVRYCGWLDSEDLASAVSQHHVFFLCSAWEGLPVAMVESMFLGLACVVPDMEGGTRHALREGGGWRYRAASSGAAARALMSILESPAEVIRQGQLARENARRQFGPGAVMAQLAQLRDAIQSISFNGVVQDVGRARAFRPVSVWAYLNRALFLLRHTEQG